MIPKEILNEALRSIAKKTGENAELRSSRPLSGGSINEAYKMETTRGVYFMKYNHAGRYPEMFEKEARGLKLLRSADEIRIPEVIGTGEAGNYSFILLEYIDPAPKTNDFWQHFGTALAKLHKTFGDRFGLDHDNYIGSLYQKNDFHNDWTGFFIEERLQPMIRMAREDGQVDSGTVKKFDHLFTILDSIFPKEPPSLIHGDLWSGNYMVDDRGEACILDPAVYYGSREMDIGMSRLFGVFGEDFYRAYNEEYPMEPGWRERVDICNLYPLMVHVNLFGQGYLGSVLSILRRFQ